MKNEKVCFFNSPELGPVKPLYGIAGAVGFADYLITNLIEQIPEHSAFESTQVGFSSVLTYLLGTHIGLVTVKIYYSLQK